MEHRVFDLGGVRITRVVESEGPLLRPAEIFPDSTPEIIKANLDWLLPRFYDEQTDRLIISIQSFLLEAEGKRILVDTCVDDCKDRARPDFHQQRWNWLDGLRSAGITPEQIDIAVSTHLHVDHVGWHTRLEGDRWVPTFPNARYLFTYPEWEYWKDNEGHPALARSGDYIGDSVWPLFHAGVADLVPMDHEIVPGVRLVPLPGHTPGHVGIAVEGALKDALLTGDLFHHPLQCCYPHWNTRFCLAPEESRSTRQKIMERCADEGMLLMPAHFPAPNAGRLERVFASDQRGHADHVYRYTFAQE